MRFGRFVECLNQLKRPQILKKRKENISKVCEIVPGTSLGILMVISFSTQNLYKLTVKMQRQRKPVVPLSPYIPLKIHLQSERRLTTGNLPQRPASEVVLITLFFGKRRFIESAKQRAVVAETSNPTTPIE